MPLWYYCCLFHASSRLIGHSLSPGEGLSTRRGSIYKETIKFFKRSTSKCILLLILIATSLLPLLPILLSSCLQRINHCKEHRKKLQKCISGHLTCILHVFQKSVIIHSHWFQRQGKIFKIKACKTCFELPWEMWKCVYVPIIPWWILLILGNSVMLTQGNRKVIDLLWNGFSSLLSEIKFRAGG